MNQSDIALLFEYNQWANHRILTAAAKVIPEQFVTPMVKSVKGLGTLRHTLLHILDTEYGWRMICQHGQVTEDLPEEEFPTLEMLVQHWQAEEIAMHTYVASLRDEEMPSIVRYTFTDETGNQKTRERVLWHCLLHVVNHGTQHRSEAAALLTAIDASPGDLDFTVFLSQRPA